MLVDLRFKTMLGVYFDITATFDIHETDICQAASRKINFLARILSYIGYSNGRILMKAFFSILTSVISLWFSSSTENNSVGPSISVSILYLHGPMKCAYTLYITIKKTRTT